MPNLITNRLEITGHEYAIFDLFLKINGGKDENGQEMFIDFNKIIPMPETVILGKQSWYEWVTSTKNWGTKCNAFAQYRISYNCIEFNTICCGVPNLIKKLSSMFPSLIIHYMYADAYWGSNVGKYVFNNRKLIYSVLPEDNTLEARAIAKELLGEEPDDED